MVWKKHFTIRHGVHERKIAAIRAGSKSASFYVWLFLVLSFFAFPIGRVANSLFVSFWFPIAPNSEHATLVQRESVDSEVTCLGWRQTLSCTHLG